LNENGELRKDGCSIFAQHQINVIIVVCFKDGSQEIAQSKQLLILILELLADHFSGVLKCVKIVAPRVELTVSLRKFIWQVWNCFSCAAKRSVNSSSWNVGNFMMRMSFVIFGF
jgi:hypothetical protein